ncbi:hypothetical protein GF376_00800 [Candidatus Peregrinibacteria bacterium]|nr:hypothetical protein [Candidatus Peregrinibacteria bacterium]
MENRKKIEQDLKLELMHCMLISSEDKKFWLNQINTLPDNLLKILLETVRRKNQMVDKYIDVALRNDQDHIALSQLKDYIKKAKARAYKIEDETEASGVEAELEKKLKDLE